MAAKVTELAPVLFKFGADHIDGIGRMTWRLPEQETERLYRFRRRGDERDSKNHFALMF
jgi:hypothetical protein